MGIGTDGRCLRNASNPCPESRVLETTVAAEFPASVPNPRISRLRNTEVGGHGQNKSCRSTDGETCAKSRCCRHFQSVDLSQMGGSNTRIEEPRRGCLNQTFQNAGQPLQTAVQ